ncbi:DUF3515 domain-containing protein [Streptomyces orinoci]|uniref:DUF3515 domain-containing protein n=1 Tax=Streptomyces orinoci TaxID=67339 RepID=A0ABV3KBK3_STRON|nr:DUF3515 domain-containing protein [Streptomyces orinoci]
MKSSLRRPLGLSAAVLLLGAAGCSSQDRAAPAAPTPSGHQAQLCRALHGALPRTVGGLPRQDTSSEFTAAWGGNGDRISLRCGVPRPAMFDKVTTQSAEIDGVDWAPERLSDGSVRCTTSLRPVYIEVTLPKKITGDGGDMSALTDLAAAVNRTVPAESTG